MNILIIYSIIILVCIIIISFKKETFIINNTKIGVYARCKNEKNLEEFMNYYYSLGFDYIIIFDDFSSPSVKELVNELKNYFNQHNCNNKENYDLIY
jgi:hypothetical protein